IGGRQAACVGARQCLEQDGLGETARARAAELRGQVELAQRELRKHVEHPGRPRSRLLGGTRSRRELGGPEPGGFPPELLDAFREVCVAHATTLTLPGPSAETSQDGAGTAQRPCHARGRMTRMLLAARAAALFPSRDARAAEVTLTPVRDRPRALT